MSEQLLGKIIHYWSHLGVAAIEITDGELTVGDDIRIKGSTTDFTQKVDSIQIEKQNVQKAQKGDSAGLKLIGKVKEHDQVYKIVP